MKGTLTQYNFSMYVVLAQVQNGHERVWRIEISKN
jgi:hypothetical protein